MRRHFFIIITLIIIMTSIAYSQEDSDLYLTLPNIDWALKIDAPDFRATGIDYREDLAGCRVEMLNAQDRLIATIFLEIDSSGLTAAEYRDQRWLELEKSDFKYSDVKQYEDENAAYSEGTIKEMSGREVNQKNLFKIIAHGGYIVDIHVSKSTYDDSFYNKLKQFVDNVTIVDDYIHTTIDYLMYGSYAYQMDQMENAAAFYQKALDLEKENPTLDEMYWLVLVDNLGMAYGISGDLESSKKTYEYGLSVKPEYPMFHYNLACTFAEMKDMDSTMVYLQNAFKYKDNMIEGEVIPDPWKDSSFKRFFDNKKFRKFLEGLK